MKPRILFLVPTTYDALVSKGVAWMIQERDEHGFFERVVTVHPLARVSRVIDLDPVHRIHELSLGAGPLSVFRVVGAFREVVRIARQERISLVRANDPYLMGLMAWWISRALAVPFCVSVHTDYQKIFALRRVSLRGRLRRLAASVLPRFVLPRAAMVLPIREHLVPALVAAGAPADAIRVMPHGVDLQKFAGVPGVDARLSFGIPPGKKVISIACRLSAENYIDDVAAAIARTAAARHDVVFVILGEGPEEGVLRRLIDTNPAAAGAVRLWPFQPADRVIALRQISDVSLCLMGGFSLIEACAAGSPVVAYDVAWHRELIRDRQTGRLIAEHDIDGVVAAIAELLDHPDAAGAMAERARQLAADHHDLQQTTLLKRRIYTELLAQPTREPA